MPPPADTKEAAAPRGGLLRALRSAAGKLPFYRAFVAVEFTALALIEKLVQLTPLPVNIMVTQGVPGIAELSRVGVQRVSLGPWPMMAAMRVIGQAAATVAASKQYGTFLQPSA